MGKRRDATRGGIEHGVVSHATHQRDKRAFSKRRQVRKEKAFIAVDIADSGSDYPPFESDVSALGSGANWLVGRRLGKPYLSDRGGDRWIGFMSRIRSWANHYHQRQVRSIEIKVPPKRGARDSTTKTRLVRQVGYYRRKVKDRVALGPTDKHARKESDLMRETIDLRPDHSRALQYMLGNRRMRRAVVNALEEIREEKIRLFEEIYGRRVVGVGEHPDSGQYHNDLWHVGIRSELVTDYGALVEDTDTSKVTGGKSKKVRIRNEFRQFGVSVGVASWYRHRAAMVELRADTNSIMGDEIQLIARNWKKARTQNGEHPRDLRLIRQLDAFVRERLEKIDDDLCRRANEEYVRWLKEGYGQGKLGLMGRSQRVEKMEMELAELRAQVRIDAARRLELNSRISELEGDVGRIQKDLNDERAAGKVAEVEFETVRSKLTTERDNHLVRAESMESEVIELREQVSQATSAKENLEKDLESASSHLGKVRAEMTQNYGRVSEERDLLQMEKNGVEADLDALREDHDHVEKQLVERDAKIQDLERQNRGLRFMESKFQALAEFVMAFFLKLLGKRALLQEFRDDKPLFIVLDAMCLEASGKKVDEWVRQFNEPTKNVLGRGEPGRSADKGVDSLPTDPENPT